MKKNSTPERVLSAIARNFAFTAIIFSRSGNTKYTAPKALKMFTRIAVRKHIKLHDTSEYTANVAQQQYSDAMVEAAATAVVWT